MSDYVMVHKGAIEKLEKARKDLIKMFEGGGKPGRTYPEQIIHITDPMWQITHRKWHRGCPNWDIDEMECAD